jgi:AMMECR1 domain-containing protein
LRVENFERAKSLVEGCFEKLSAALREAKKDENVKWNSFGKRMALFSTIKGSTRDVKVWEKLKFALGGDSKMEALVEDLQDAKATLQLLLDSMNLLVLKRLSKK